MSYGFLDTETSGLDSDKNCILQLGIIITDDSFDELERYSTLVVPFAGAIIEDKALEINKLKIEECKKGKSEVDALTELNKIIHKHDPIIVGYNLDFDLKFIKSAMFRNKKHLLSSGVNIDLQQAVNRQQDIRKYSLKSSCEHLGITPGDHTALGDAFACLEIARKVLV